MPPIELSPTQRTTVEHVVAVLAVAQIVTLRAGPGAGKSIMLQQLQKTLDAGLVDMHDFYLASQGSDPLAMEDAFMQICLAALKDHACLLIDDFELFVALTQGAAYPRSGYLDAVCATLVACVLHAGKHLFLVHEEPDLPPPLWRRAMHLAMPEFSPADYAFFGQRFLPVGMAAALNYDQIHRFAAHLNAHDFKRICLYAVQDPHIDTERFVALLRAQHLASNVDLEEVQPVTLGDLCGLEDVVESLLAGVIVPMENDQLAATLRLQPKHGVLLAGPPGTGKTTIGRALAHRLKGKFFLIDGTAVAEAIDFQYKLVQTFRAAEENAPAVVFIDDSDVIFESSRAGGFHRFLLTQLDGLHSRSASKVCVVMTAMNVASLPPALVRSGRVELWLETHLPDGMARMQILYQQMCDLPAEITTLDLLPLVEATDALTGADLKAIVEDAKSRYAYDRMKGSAPRPADEYYRAAIASVRQNKERYVAAEAQLREDLRSGHRMWSWEAEDLTL